MSKRQQTRLSSHFLVRYHEDGKLQVRSRGFFLNSMPIVIKRFTQNNYKIIHKKNLIFCDNNRHKVNIGNCLPVNHFDVITFHWKSSANPRWNYTGNGRILRGSAAIRGGIKLFRGGIISGQVSGIAGGSEKSTAGVGVLVKIPPGLYCK